MKKVLNLFLALVLTLSMVTILVACSKKDTRETLKVGMECNYAPFNWTENKKSDTNYPIDGTKKYAEGYDVQMAKKIADELDMKLVIKQLDWDALIPSIQNGIIDLIIAGMSPLAERKIDIDFTSPYYTSEHVMLIKKSSSYILSDDISDFAGAKIAGQIGTTYIDIAHAVEGAVTNKEWDKPTVPELITELQNGIIDGTVVELPVAEGLIAADNTLSMCRFEAGKGFKYINETDDEGNVTTREIEDTDRIVSIGIKKNREELLNKINDFLSTLTETTRVSMMSDAVTANAFNE